MTDPLEAGPIVQLMVEMNVIYARLLSLGLDHSEHNVIKIPKTPSDEDYVCDFVFDIDDGNLFMAIDIDEKHNTPEEIHDFLQRGKQFLQTQLIMMQPHTTH